MRSSAVADASLSAKILNAQDNERRRISRELHDSVGQSLTAAKLALGKLKRKFTDADLDDAYRRVDEALSEVRTVSYLLHPLSLELLGLRSSILTYVQGFEQRTGMRASIKIPDQLPKFDDVTLTALFRIIQECFTNVYKHAKASEITIRISVTPREFRLEVSDDGLGFQHDARERVGIRGMRERVRELRGTSIRRDRRKSGQFSDCNDSASSPTLAAEPLLVRLPELPFPDRYKPRGYVRETCHDD